MVSSVDRFCPVIDEADLAWFSRHFNGDESFDTGPMAPESELPTSSRHMGTSTGLSGTTKL